MKVRTFSRCTRYIAFVFLAAILVLPAGAAENDARVKYVFLMIGDGMGPTQRQAGELYRMGELKAEGKTVDEMALCMDRLPVRGVCETNSASSSVTDSAAAATALATGHKTTNGVIGMDRDREKELKNIAELAQEKGMRTGVITSVPADHATPAGFYAHVTSRNKYWDISMQLAKSKLYFAAGSKLYGTDKKYVEDNEDPRELAQKNGFRILNTRDEVLGLKKEDGRTIVTCHDLGVRTIDREPGKSYLTLAETLTKAIEVMDCEQGFFIMLEGGDIDWDCHANDAGSMVRQVVDFDNAVQVAFDFYKKHRDETLLIVTADHETGALEFDEDDPRAVYDALSKQDMGIDKFKQLVKPYKERKADYEEIVPLVEKHFGLTNRNEEEERELRNVWEQSIGGAVEQVKDALIRKLYGNRDPFLVRCCWLISERAGLDWDSFGHSDTDVPITAVGPYAEQFGGERENTAVPRIIAKAIGVELEEK